MIYYCSITDKIYLIVDDLMICEDRTGKIGTLCLDPYDQALMKKYFAYIGELQDLDTDHETPKIQSNFMHL